MYGGHGYNMYKMCMNINMCIYIYTYIHTGIYNINIHICISYSCSKKAPSMGASGRSIPIPKPLRKWLLVPRSRPHPARAPWWAATPIPRPLGTQPSSEVPCLALGARAGGGGAARRGARPSAAHITVNKTLRQWYIPSTCTNICFHKAIEMTHGQHGRRFCLERTTEVKLLNRHAFA